MNTTRRVFSLFLIATCSVACQSSGSKTEVGGDVAGLRAADLAWSAAANRKDLAATVGFMAEDGETLPPNEPAARGKAAVQKTWEGLMALPGFQVEWKPQRVEVAKSGELGYTSGTYTLSFKDDTGRAITDHGKYVEIWKRVGGQWKCSTDMFNSDLPLP